MNPMRIPGIFYTNTHLFQLDDDGHRIEDIRDGMQVVVTDHALAAILTALYAKSSSIHKSG